MIYELNVKLVFVVLGWVVIYSLPVVLPQRLQVVLTVINLILFKYCLVKYV